jgi:hypothetical protein
VLARSAVAAMTPVAAASPTIVVVVEVPRALHHLS